MPDTPPLDHAWRRTLAVTAGLLLLWLVASFGVALFARELRFELFGTPFGVWIAGQGALVVFLLIVWAAARIGAADDRGESADGGPAADSDTP